MDVSGIAALATQMSQTKTADAIQMAVLKKAMDIESQGAMQLVQSAASAAPSNPPHLGNAVDTFV